MSRSALVSALALLVVLVAAAFAHGEVVQQRGVRVTVSGELTPKALPR